MKEYAVNPVNVNPVTSPRSFMCRWAQYAGLLLLAFVLTGADAASKPTTAEFTASRDTYITQESQGEPGDRSHRNYGASHVLRVDTQYNGKKSHILLAFDLSKIPKDANIDSAMLVLGPPVKPMVGSLDGIEIRRMLRDDWLEGDQGNDTHVDHTFTSWVAVRYDNGNPVEWTGQGAMGEKDSDAKSAIRLNAGEIDKLETGAAVTDLVKAWQASRSGSFGLLVRSTNEKINYLGWASKEMPDAKGPFLVVQWSKP